MADLSDINAAQSVKIIASDLAGVETAPVASLDDGNGGKALEVSQAATGFVVSTVNSTVSQLASGATFTGSIETVFNQQSGSVLLTSDQNGTLSVFQYIDLSGTFKISTFTYTIVANIPFSRAFQLNGNYINFTFKNTGGSTTITFNLNVAYGTLPSVSNLGNEPVSLDEVNGVVMGARPDGFLRTQIDPTTLLIDNFETLNTTDTWTIGGTASPAGTSGNLTVAPGAAANATSFARSIPTFTQGSNAYLQLAVIIQLEAGAVTGNKRFWGLGNFSTPTFSVPVTNGVVFEVDSTTGALLASVYSNSVRTNSATLVRPIDGGFHRYAIYFKASRVYFELDNIAVATFAFPNLQVALVSTIIGSVNGASTVASAPTLNSSLFGLADTGRNATKISDGNFPWRVAQVGITSPVTTSFGLTTRPLPYEPITYCACASAFVSATASTDVFTITGSPSRIVRINRIRISATTTSGSAIKVNMTLVKRSSVDTGGTSVAVTVVPNDSTNAASSATVNYYTANPTLGTVVGTVRATTTGVTASGISGGDILFDFFNDGGQPLILRGTSEQLALNFGGATISGSVVSVFVEFAEVVS